ncbi:polysaccharide deacetylase family protein [Candidatus Shapirobacteria bacterium]|nr:polysaccharide deacetylase family protein [Candidatus Shapirobacteria bacterium]
MKNILLSFFWFLGVGRTEFLPPVMPTPTIALTPTVHQVTFAEINQKYGPCATVNVLMYHHIQEEKLAKKLGRTGLNVSPEWFEKHLQYLKDKQYNVLRMDELADFINGKRALPKKAVVITLDDAYEDNYLSAYPILKKYNFPATLFTPTGLVDVMDYLTWSEINDMKNSGLIYFGNHTWSHHSALDKKEVLEKEIGLADTQLAEKGLNGAKVFAYPYGKPSNDAEAILAKSGYSMAFTTKQGNILCVKQRYTLPRIRVGNAPLSKYGL